MSGVKRRGPGKMTVGCGTEVIRVRRRGKANDFTPSRLPDLAACSHSLSVEAERFDQHRRACRDRENLSCSNGSRPQARAAGLGQRGGRPGRRARGSPTARRPGFPRTPLATDRRIGTQGASFPREWNRRHSEGNELLSEWNEFHSACRELVSEWNQFDSTCNEFHSECN